MRQEEKGWGKLWNLSCLFNTFSSSLSASVWLSASVLQCLGFTVCHCLGVSNSPVFTLKLYRQHTEEDHIFHIWIVAIFDPFHFHRQIIFRHSLSYSVSHQEGESHSQTGSTNFLLMCTTCHDTNTLVGETCFRHVEVSEYGGGGVPQPPESWCGKSRGQIAWLIGHQTGRKRLISPPMHLNSLLDGLLGVFSSSQSGRGGHLLNIIFNLRPLFTIKFGETLLLVGTKLMDQ